MTYEALETTSVAFDRARRMMRCGCPLSTPICLDVLSCRIMGIDDGENLDAMVRCFCPRCKKRDQVLIYTEMMPHLDDEAFKAICNNDLLCGHVRALEISQWCTIKATGRHTKPLLQDEFYHILYCRTCRKSTRIVLSREHAIR